MDRFLVYLRTSEMDGSRRREGYLAFGDVDHLFTEEDVRRGPGGFLFQLEDVTQAVMLYGTGVVVLECRILNPKELPGPSLVVIESRSEPLVFDMLDPLDKLWDDMHEATLREEIPGIDEERTL